jgi:hypothetical protein
VHPKVGKALRYGSNFATWTVGLTLHIFFKKKVSKPANRLFLLASQPIAEPFFFTLIVEHSKMTEAIGTPPNCTQDRKLHEALV